MAQRRRKGTGSLYEITDWTGNRKWRAEEGITDAQGKKVRVTGTGQSPEEAWQRLALNKAKRMSGLHTLHIQHEQQKRTYTPKDRKRHETPRKYWHFAEYARHWNLTREITARTRRNDADILEKYILPAIGPTPLEKLTRNKVFESWAKIEEATRDTHANRQRAYSIWRAAMNKAEKQGLIQRNFLTDIDAPRAKAGIPVETMGLMIKKTLALNGYLTRTDKTTGKARKDTMKMYWARLMLAQQGLRPTEALGLTWDKVQLTKGTRNSPPHIVVSQILEYSAETQQWEIRPGTKTRNTRIVALNNDTLEALKAWKKEQDKLRKKNTWKTGQDDGATRSNLVLTHDDGSPISYWTDNDKFKALLREQQENVKDNAKKYVFSIGKLRAVSATIVLDAGASPLLVAKTWGHSLEVQQQYYYSGQLQAQVPELAKAHGQFGIQHVKETE
ncbi:tyrosine-type recombinase/integrase [Dermabacter sp. HMSC08H10]|uniref:tyrosine-type recombinase/integrase n=1 Tax=Dermabacter sp. HMSC08H10 TaxID=1581144 RepID=UPI00114CDECF|nr:tyrosine-type recombinase/integrase [Dermabacter sp. HMSC08H10]